MNDRKQEPVAWWDGKESVVFTNDEIYTPNWTDYWIKPLYTTPPQRPWVGLTNQDIHKAVIETGIHVFEGDIYAFVQMLQDVLQEKNNGS